jgi:hypothetical protein
VADAGSLAIPGIVSGLGLGMEGMFNQYTDSFSIRISSVFGFLPKIHQFCSTLLMPIAERIIKSQAGYTILAITPVSTSERRVCIIILSQSSEFSDKQS